MILYVDASAIVSIVSAEAASLIVEAVLDRDGVVAIVSDLALAESSAALARNGRVGRWTEIDMRTFYRALDLWASDAAEAVPVSPADIDLATDFVRRPGIALRAPDAIHIAAAHRIGATLLTLDRGMAHAAAALGVDHLNPAEESAI